MRIVIGSISVNINVTVEIDIADSSLPATPTQIGHKAECPNCGKIVGFYDTIRQSRRALAGHYRHCPGPEPDIANGVHEMFRPNRNNEQ